MTQPSDKHSAPNNETGLKLNRRAVLVGSAAMTDRSLAMILDDSAGITPAKPQAAATEPARKRGWFGRS